MTGTRAWAILIAYIAAVDLTAIRRGRPDHTLSATVDRARARHTLADTLITGAIVTTAGHLLRVWPDKADPFRIFGLRR